MHKYKTDISGTCRFWFHRPRRRELFSNRWRVSLVRARAHVSIRSIGTFRISHCPCRSRQVSETEGTPRPALVAPDGETVLSGFAPSYPVQFQNVSFGLAPMENDIVWNFFSTPTPGKPNKGGNRAGPNLSVVEKNPMQPEVGQLTIKAVVRPVNAPISTVKLYYRKMFELFY